MTRCLPPWDTACATPCHSAACEGDASLPDDTSTISATDGRWSPPPPPPFSSTYPSSTARVCCSPTVPAAAAATTAYSAASSTTARHARSVIILRVRRVLAPPRCVNPMCLSQKKMSRQVSLVPTPIKKLPTLRLTRALPPVYRGMSTDDVVLVVDGALWPHADAGEAASSSPATYLRAWGSPGAYTAGRTFGKDGISQWGAHITRLRRSLVALADATPLDFERVRLPASDEEMEALVAPSVVRALAECTARGIEGPIHGACAHSLALP